MTSVLQDWVMALPLRHQGVLVVALRGCDDQPKLPLASIERRLTAAIRGYVLVPFDSREVGVENGSFMSMEIPTQFKVSSMEHHSAHWLLHVMHAIEILGYHHPTDNQVWCVLYYRFCKAFHVNPETREEMEARLTEDRIASGEVVS